MLWTGLGLGSGRMDDAGYREVAERALGYARVEFRDEIASLKRENAALKRKVARKPRGGGSAAGHGPVVEDDPDSSSLLLAVKRARTLALFLLLLSCTTAILEGYEETLAAHVSLSFFVPFLIGCGLLRLTSSMLAFVSTPSTRAQARRQLRRHERGRRHLGDRARRRAHAVF